MVWLISHMWMALALAAAAGLSFGWAVRGLSLKAKTRDALVARDVALTELSQSRLEIDQLYAAQSKGIGAAAEAGDEALRAELEAREARLATLGSQLANSQAELEALRSRATTGAGVVSDTVQAPDRLDAGINPANAAVEWRNRYLESRVRALETHAVKTQEATPMTAPEAGPAIEIDALQAELDGERARADMAETRITELESAAAAATAATIAASTIQENDTPQAAQPIDAAMADKAAWQTRYLRQRLAYIETHGFTPRGPVGQVAVDAAEQEAPLVLTEEVAKPPGGDEVASAGGAGELEQELARLRWRNRYLEGRLAYIDGDAPKSDAELAEEEKLAGVLEASQPDSGPQSLKDTAQSDDDNSTPEPFMMDIERPEDSDEATSPEAVAAGIASLSAGFDRGPGHDEAQEIVAAEADEIVEDLSAVGFAEADHDAPEMDNAPEAALVTQPETDADETPGSPTDFANAALSEDSFAAPAETFLATIDSGGNLLKPDMVPVPADGGDDLTQINGIGGQTSEMLQDLGIWLYSQIASWSAQNVAWVNRHFNAEDRVESERWLEQAAALTQSENAGTA